jgi:hypothetical protein
MSTAATSTLDGWLGRVATKRPRSKTPPARPLSPLTRPTRVVLGVLGTRNSTSYDDFLTQILAPIEEAWGTPDEIVAPAESDSTQILVTWATRAGIPISLVTADWIKQGKRAGLLRDARIQREATHLLLLQGPRSNTLSTLAQKLQRKGRPVVISSRPGEPVSIPETA